MCEIQPNAFDGCIALRAAHFAKRRLYWCIGEEGEQAEVPFSEAELADPALMAVYLTETYLTRSWRRTLLIEQGCLREYRMSVPAITLPDEVTSLFEKVLQFHGELRAVTLPAGLERIGAEAFSYCDGLTEITLPAGLTAIDPLAFEECDRLAQVVFQEPAGWCVFEAGGAEQCIAAADLADPQRAAELLTATYHGCAWRRS